MRITNVNISQYIQCKQIVFFFTIFEVTSRRASSRPRPAPPRPPAHPRRPRAGSPRSRGRSWPQRNWLEMVHFRYENVFFATKNAFFE